MSFPLTTQQRAVVTDRGGCLLVAAAAGSGKTRVLVERLLSRVEDEGLDIDRFLVITYTKAAAAELRGRIVDELAARLAKKPGDRHLRRQATLVYKTQISTIHAFCAQLLRECGHLLDLEADFRLCDEGEAGVLRLRAMDDLLERRYETIGEDPDFALLVDTLSAGRDDSRLVQIALDIYGKVQAHPDPSAWLREQLAAFDLSGTADAGETVWGRLLLADAARQGRYWQGRMAHARELCAGDEKLERGYAPSLSATVEGLGAFAAAAEAGWDRAAALSEIPFPKLGAVRSCGDPMAQEQIKDEVIRIARLFDEVYSLFGLPYKIELSTMPDDHIGSVEDWEVATKALADAITSIGKSYEVNEGDGAFYGPKLDFHIQDSLGRTWQCGTIQLDYQLPGRFDLEYIGADGEKHCPVMIHRVVFGSIERFIGVITEHFAGAFPTWLAPVQVKVLPITDRAADYADCVAKRLDAAGFRVETDRRNEKIGKKIREAQLEKVPYMLVVGDKEAESGQVAVRTRAGGDQGVMALDAFLAALKEEVDTKAIR